MRIVELYPKEECSVVSLDSDLQTYFHGEAKVLSLTVQEKKYSFICHQEGVQVKNNEVKALYGPAIVCNESLQSLTEEEASLVQRYMNEYQFDLSNISLQ
ncbi:hypothetical protein [Halalkalibacter okhensis]|uniref:Uncharacterized protein n=1 Tax=Halalkalibacter okhensis TaxID=333138 RepID=A0A0B0IIM8_9BACI|nr:hypothetical protein [Halalkalibacter okhensis]KHF39874.1 hypothetical protein LQ50_12470 [Halalkalibacter okhensis]